MKLPTVGILGAQGNGKRSLADALQQANAVMEVAELRSVSEATDCQIVLLMGLDSAALPPAAIQDDTRLRHDLAAAGISFHVLYGADAERLQQAQRIIANKLTSQAGLNVDRKVNNTSGRETLDHETWHWACDTCSDPACEHRLFSSLLAKREAA